MIYNYDLLAYSFDVADVVRRQPIAIQNIDPRLYQIEVLVLRVSLATLIDKRLASLGAQVLEPCSFGVDLWTYPVSVDS